VILALLEKIMKALRFVFLKLGVLFSRGWVNIKNRRKKEPEPPMEEFKRPTRPEREITEEEAIIAKVRNYLPEKKIVIKKEPVKPEEPAKTAQVEPMISKKAVRPKNEMKDRLEELLIERIAANPKDIEAYQRLGQYYMEIENYEYAKECFKQIVKLAPADRNAKYTLRKLERLLGQ
jgi:tetratricopeptide (TPR) repeat protein